MKRLFLALLLVLTWAGKANAQGSFYRIGPFPQSGLAYVCPAPDGGTPCPSPSAIFSNATLTTAISNPIYVPQGATISFYIAGGQYTIQFPVSGYNQIVTIGSGGGITSVSSLPGTCTPGVTANVSLSAGPGTVQQEYQCGPNANQWFPFNPTLTVSPLTFGAKWDVRAVTDCTFTNTSNVVTCPAGEAQFSSADLGKIFSGRTAPGALTTGCIGAACGSEVIPQGFICTINSANSINVGLTYPGCAADNATAACTPSSVIQCTSLWGTQDDSAAINLAAAAAWTGNSCKTLWFPAGMAFFTVPPGGLLNVTIPNGSPCAGAAIADATQGGAQVAGLGGSNSILVPLSTVNFANCTGGNSGTACISGPPNWFAHDWGVWGFGLSGSGTSHTNNLIEFQGFNPSCTAAAAWNMNFSEWQTASSNSKGFVLANGCGVLYATNILSEGFGNEPCYVGVANNVTTISAFDCFGSSGGNSAASMEFAMGPGGRINSTGSMYWGTNNSNSAAAVKISGAGPSILNSFSDYIVDNAGNNNFGIFLTNSGTDTVNLQGSLVSAASTGGTANSHAIFCGTTPTACNINAFAATLDGSGTTSNIFQSNNALSINFTDACSNTFKQGSIASVAINLFGSCSITGTPITAAKLVLSAGWGASAAWTALSGATQSVQGTVTNTGAGQAANPTITYTFPTPFQQAPAFCSAYQVGGTQAIIAATQFLTPSSLTATGVVFTYNGTPTVNLTEVYQILCTNQ